MDPLLVLVLVLIGLPLVSFVVMGMFALTADFEFEDIVVRGGHLRGAIAAAVAKIVVGDAKTFQLPLMVTLRKTGIMGQSTPILGGVVVRDLEWRLHIDGEHAATITEARSVRIGTASKTIELPVNAEIHPPGGLVKSLQKFRRTQKAAAETRLDVKGHVIVKHWWMTREVPVRVTRYIVLGEPTPTIDHIEWHPRTDDDGPAPEEASLDVALTNPYREEVLEAPLAITLVQVRRMRRDPVVGRLQEPVRLEPGQTWRRRFRVRVERAATQKPPDPEKEAKGIRVGARLTWGDQRLRPDAPPAEPEEGDEDPEDAQSLLETRLRVHRLAPRLAVDDEPRARLRPDNQS